MYIYIYIYIYTYITCIYMGACSRCMLFESLGGDFGRLSSVSCGSAPGPISENHAIS